MRLLIDENVPDSTAKAFEALGHETIYVRDENSRARDQAVAHLADIRPLPAVFLAEDAGSAGLGDGTDPAGRQMPQTVVSTYRWRI